MIRYKAELLLRHKRNAGRFITLIQEAILSFEDAISESRPFVQQCSKQGSRSTFISTSLTAAEEIF